MPTKQLLVLSILGLLAASNGVRQTSGSVPCEQAGPQSPRDLDRPEGENPVRYGKALPHADLRLCDIHFHRNAEHKSAQYPTRKGSGEHAGFVCSGRENSTPPPGGRPSGGGGCEGIAVGDTVEVHWVFTSCDVEPAPGLGSCLANCVNPQLRVEARVFYLSDREGGLDFARFADESDVTLPRAPHAVEYLGSTTGPSFDAETCSAFQATWNVGPSCRPLDKASLDKWCEDNVFDEDSAHGVRDLVTDVRLLSKID